MKSIENHQVECLVGKTIAGIYVGVLDTKNGSIQVIRIDYNEGPQWFTRWLVPVTSAQNNTVICALNFEQYAEFLEFHQE